MILPISYKLIIRGFRYLIGQGEDVAWWLLCDHHVILQYLSVDSWLCNPNLLLAPSDLR